MFAIQNQFGKIGLLIGTILLISVAACQRTAPSIVPADPPASSHPASTAQDPNQPVQDEIYEWDQLLSRDSIAPIYDPIFLSATESTYADDELIIGVEINGDARAYAIGALSAHEIVNDTIGGRPILVTW